MKKLTFIICIFLLLIFTTNTLPVKSLTNPRTFSQGIYNARDLNLLVGTPITVKLNSPNDSILIIVINSKQVIQEFVRLGPQSTEHTLKPLDYDHSLIIFGTGSIIIS